MKLLIVEDNLLLGRSLKQGLEELGWTVDLAQDGEEGLYCAGHSAYDVMLVDRMLPKVNGTDMISKLRIEGNHVPALMLTARGSVEDRISGLELGADDYLAKPFEMGELVARLKALHRRSVGRGDPQLTFGRLVVDLSGMQALVDGTALVLTSKEFDLLAALAARPGQVFSRSELADLLYGIDDEPVSNSLDVLLARLRRKLAGAGVSVATVRGKGFVFRVENAPA